MSEPITRKVVTHVLYLDQRVRYVGPEPLFHDRTGVIEEFDRLDNALVIFDEPVPEDFRRAYRHVKFLVPEVV